VELTTERNASAWRFQPEPLSLAAIYILEPRQEELTNPTIEPVSAVTALMNLMMHRSANFLKLERKKQAREWEAFSQIASNVPIRRVKRPDDLSKLPELCDAIINDAESILAIRV